MCLCIRLSYLLLLAICIFSLSFLNSHLPSVFISLFILKMDSKYSSCVQLHSGIAKGGLGRA